MATKPPGCNTNLNHLLNVNWSFGETPECNVLGNVSGVTKAHPDIELLKCTEGDAITLEGIRLWVGLEHASAKERMFQQERGMALEDLTLWARWTKVEEKGTWGRSCVTIFSTLIARGI
jgi:hypothetical protein